MRKCDEAEEFGTRFQNQPMPADPGNPVPYTIDNPVPHTTIDMNNQTSSGDLPLTESHIEGVQKKSSLAQNLAISKKSTIFLLSL